MCAEARLVMNNWIASLVRASVSLVSKHVCTTFSLRRCEGRRMGPGYRGEVVGSITIGLKLRAGLCTVSSPPDPTKYACVTTPSGLPARIPSCPTRIDMKTE